MEYKKECASFFEMMRPGLQMPVFIFLISTDREMTPESRCAPRLYKSDNLKVIQCTTIDRTTNHLSDHVTDIINQFHWRKNTFINKFYVWIFGCDSLDIAQPGR